MRGVESTARFETEGGQVVEMAGRAGLRGDLRHTAASRGLEILAQQDECDEHRGSLESECIMGTKGFLDSLCSWLAVLC